MCGLNGIFAYHDAAPRPCETELLATREHMRARGPDGEGLWWNADRRVGLGHRRLAILDLSDRALQPMASEDGRFVVVFNGEIYNYPELRAELEADGVAFRTTSDTEALLHLYARHGTAMVRRLRGMFAFAVWDQVRSGLFLARDPYGIKPLYFADDGRSFRFASQVKALLAGGQVSRDPEPAGLVGFCMFGYVPEPFTLYRDIRALPAGHTLWVDREGAQAPRAYANLAKVMAEEAGDPVPAADLPERTRAGVLESVRAHLLSDVEVGVFLSAGVDSGALLGLMRDAGQEDIRAITLAFEEFSGTDEDEAPLAARVAQQYGARHSVRRVGEGEFRSDLPAILEAMDQPSIDGVNTWFVAKATREAGIKVAMSGLGGDELLAGYPSFVDVPRWHRYGTVTASPWLGRATRSAISVMAPGLAAARPKALGFLEYSGSWAGTYLLRRGVFLPHELTRFLDEKLVREGLRRLDPLRRIEASLAPDPRSDTARVCLLESTQYMRDQLLRDADWAGMAHGLEIRVPLVDVGLFRRMAPVIRNLRVGAGKAALAGAPSVPLPADIVDRGKTGFFVPTGAWMNSAAQTPAGVREIKPRRKGLASRQWSSLVLEAAGAW
ncbi:asparagine synthase (glutamine-hydrolyzing) [Microbaculum marinum]|uniref:asparagine synthase (glutamine-hydrolyzing) n=1 Tax=Microbaculum marinum TaxID=1764581 RepID=A0AAW9RGK7_9HYPH